MSKGKKVVLIIVACFFGLLVLANSFCLWILIDAYKKENTDIDMRSGTYMSFLLDCDKETLANSGVKDAVKDILADEPYILINEPVILLANPDLKPAVADILADNPEILEKIPNIVARYPDLLEMNSKLETAVKQFLEKPENEGCYPKIQTLVN